MSKATEQLKYPAMAKSAYEAFMTRRNELAREHNERIMSEPHWNPKHLMLEINIDWDGADALTKQCFDHLVVHLSRLLGS